MLSHVISTERKLDSKYIENKALYRVANRLKVVNEVSLTRRYFESSLSGLVEIKSFVGGLKLQLVNII